MLDIPETAILSQFKRGIKSSVCSLISIEGCVLKLYGVGFDFLPGCVTVGRFCIFQNCYVEWVGGKESKIKAYGG